MAYTVVSGQYRILIMPNFMVLAKSDVAVVEMLRGWDDGNDYE